MCEFICDWCENTRYSITCSCDQTIVSFCSDECFDASWEDEHLRTADEDRTC
jgi:hypothetical protein